MNQRLLQTKLSRRTFLAGAAGVAGSLALGACGTGNKSSKGSTKGTTTITAWYWDDSLKYIVDAFHKSQSKVRVNFQKLSWDDVHLKLITSLAAGSGAPDVCALDFEYLGAFSVRGGLFDLKASPFNAGEFEKDIVPYKWRQCLSGDGRLFAFPWDVAPGGLWYRADIFNAAGLESDPDKLQTRIKSNDDWFALGGELRQKVPGTALIADAYNDVFWPAVLEQGQTWYDDAGNLVVAKKCTAALELAASAQKLKIDADIDWWTDDWNAGVKKKAFAGMNTACWEQSLLMSTNPESAGQWRVLRAPGGDYSWGGGFYAIPSQTKKAEAAWEFIKFAAASAEGQNAIMKAAGIFPAYMPAWKDPLYDAPVDFFGGQRVYKLWQEIAQNAPGYPVHPGYIETKNIVEAAVADFKKAGGTGDAAKAMADAEAQVKKSVPALGAGGA